MNTIKFVTLQGRAVKIKICQRPYHGWFPGITAKRAYEFARRKEYTHKRLKY